MASVGVDQVLIHLSRRMENLRSATVVLENLTQFLFTNSMTKVSEGNTRKDPIKVVLC